MIGHLGTRASALLDGQLSAEETERAWEHVHSCHVCRDRVEREGWVKTRLSGLSFEVAAPSTPAWLKGSLIDTPAVGSLGDAYLVDTAADRRRAVGLAALGGGAVGAAVMGVLVLGVGPASAPSPGVDRRAPVTSVIQPDTPRAATPTAAASRRAWFSVNGTR